MLFEHHDATTQAYSLKRGSIGAIDHVSGTTLCFWLHFDEHNSSLKPIINGWRYAIYSSDNPLTNPIERGGCNGNWYAVVANNIATTITRWLNNSLTATE